MGCTLCYSQGFTFIIAFPKKKSNVIGALHSCEDKAPWVLMNFVNLKSFHSINVQVRISYCYC